VSRTRARILLIVIGALLGLYLLDQIVVEPILDSLNQAQEGLARARTALQKVDRELSEKSALQQKILAVRSELARRDKQKIDKALSEVVDRISGLKANIRSSPESKRSDNFSELQFVIDGDGTIEAVEKMMYELTYFKDYFRVRRPVIAAREPGRVNFTLTGSALTANGAVAPSKGTGMMLPDKPPLKKYEPIHANNVFAPHPSLIPKPEKPPAKPDKPRDPKKVDARISGIVIENGQPAALLEIQGKKPLWVKKGDSVGKYTIVDIVKSGGGPADPADEVILERGKKKVTIRYGETARLLHDDEEDVEDSK
jgi:hypothetical protein